MNYCSTCVIGSYINWTLLPWQRILERITHVEQAPSNDNIVVKSHIKTDLERRKTGFINHYATSYQYLHSRSLRHVGYSMC